MTANKGIKLITELLNIEGIKVISQRQHEGIGIIFQIEPIRKESVCPPYKRSLRQKMKRTAMDNNYMIQVLNCCFINNTLDSSDSLCQA